MNGFNDNKGLNFHKGMITKLALVNSQSPSNSPQKHNEEKLSKKDKGISLLDQTKSKLHNSAHSAQKKISSAINSAVNAASNHSVEDSKSTEDLDTQNKLKKSHIESTESAKSSDTIPISLKELKKERHRSPHSKQLAPSQSYKELKQRNTAAKFQDHLSKTLGKQISDQKRLDRNSHHCSPEKNRFTDSNTTESKVDTCKSGQKANHTPPNSTLQHVSSKPSKTDKIEQEVSEYQQKQTFGEQNRHQNSEKYAEDFKKVINEQTAFKNSAAGIFELGINKLASCSGPLESNLKQDLRSSFNNDHSDLKSKKEFQNYPTKKLNWPVYQHRQDSSTNLMSLNPKRLPVIKSRRDKVTKLTENCTKMWSNSFADVAHMLSLLGHCQYKENREKIFKVLTSRITEISGQKVMHGLKATTVFLFLVSVKQQDAIKIAMNYSNLFKRNLQNLVVSQKDRHATRFFSRVLNQLIYLLDHTEYINEVEKVIRSDLIRCYEGLDLIDSAKEGNVFFPNPFYEPYCIYWVYPPVNKLVRNAHSATRSQNNYKNIYHKNVPSNYYENKVETYKATVEHGVHQVQYRQYVPTSQNESSNNQFGSTINRRSVSSDVLVGPNAFPQSLNDNNNNNNNNQLMNDSNLKEKPSGNTNNSKTKNESKNGNEENFLISFD